MRKIRLASALSFAALLLVLATTAVCSPYAADCIALEKHWIRNASLYVIVVDLNDPRLRIDIGLPAKGISHSESFLNMVKRLSPLAAVTGTYFDTRSLLPVGTIVVDGKTVHANDIGNTVCFLDCNRVKFIDTAKGESCDMAGAISGMRTGPRLLNSGSYCVNPAREGFRYPGLFGRRTRMALGVTRNNKLLLVSVVTPVTFPRLAEIMQSLGALDAVTLDGGTSSAMYFRGKMVRRPGRALTNIIEVCAAPEDSRVGRRNIEPPPGPGVGAASASRTLLAVAIAGPNTGPAGEDYRSTSRPETEFAVFDESVAVPETSSLRFAKGRSAFFPVNRAKFAGLEGLDHSKHLVNISTNAQVVHDLIP